MKSNFPPPLFLVYLLPLKSYYNRHLKFQSFEYLYPGFDKLASVFNSTSRLRSKNNSYLNLRVWKNKIATKKPLTHSILDHRASVPARGQIPLKVSPQCGPGCVEYTSSPQRTSWDIGDTWKAGQCASERGPPAASDWKISWDKIRTRQNQVLSLGYFLLTLLTTKGL